MYIITCFEVFSGCTSKHPKTYTTSYHLSINFIQLNLIYEFILDIVLLENNSINII